MDAILSILSAGIFVCGFLLLVNAEEQSILRHAQSARIYNRWGLGMMSAGIILFAIAEKVYR